MYIINYPEKEPFQKVLIHNDGSKTIEYVTLVEQRIEPMKLAFFKQDWKFSEDEYSIYLETDVSSNIRVFDKNNWNDLATEFFCNEVVPLLIPKNKSKISNSLLSQHLGNYFQNSR